MLTLNNDDDESDDHEDDDDEDDDDSITAHFALKSFVRLVFASIEFTKILKSPGSSRWIWKLYFGQTLPEA